MNIKPCLANLDDDCENVATLLSALEPESVTTAHLGEGDVPAPRRIRRRVVALTDAAQGVGYAFVRWALKLLVCLVCGLFVGWGVLGAQRPLLAAGIVGNGTPQSCTEAAFTAVLSGGGHVSFNCGAAPHLILLTSQKTISTDTTIDGGGLITLSGGGSTRLFSVQNGATLTVRGLRLIDGYTTTNGGAIYAERLSSLVIEASEFSGNVAHNGGAIATNGWGANDVGVVVMITGSTFSHNIATAPGIAGGGNGGGALYLSGGSAATVSDSLFSQNQASNGGAIHLLHSNLLATAVTFSQNVANNTAGGGGGGAIYMDGTKGLSGEVRVLGSTFSQNSTNQLGGAIFSFPEGSCVTFIDQSLFAGNVSTNRGQGGAIYHQSATGIGPLRIERSLFVNNRAVAAPLDAASQGGALWLLDAPVTIRNSTFTGNDATHSQSASMAPDNWRRGFGGAIRTSSETTIINSTLAGNTAGFVGGAIAGTAVVQNSIIANNSGGNPWNIQQNCTVALTNGGGNIQYPQKTTNLGNDYECLTGQTAVNPLLGALADNGGATWTLPLLAGSPAINSGLNTVCPETDQRGFARADGQCDVGAYEAGAAPAPILRTISPDRAGVNQATAPFTLTLTGAEFTADCVVRWNGAARPTTFVDSGRLTAVIPASDIAAPGTAVVTVYDPARAAESEGRPFTIVPVLYQAYLPLTTRQTQ